MMEDPKTQLINKLRSSNNILTTVSRNPSVDQLSALLGLTLLLNKQGKHAAAVFSGEVPSTIEFLQPEDTIEKNTDSLRDFIIALDKSKADKLRYKVEDDVVRIFITPYKTSISEADFDFSQGDFNVDVVVALGVQQQEDLDEAITAHGRILHDATVASVNTSVEGGLGSINWHDPSASSLSELVTEVSQALGPELMDEQIATALLTGIVSETERFSNDKTSPQTMSMSAVLMAAGANQQLVASKLEEPVVDIPQTTSGDDGEEPMEQPDSDGTIEIDHSNDPAPAAPDMELPAPDENAIDDSASVGLNDQLNDYELGGPVEPEATEVAEATVAVDESEAAPEQTAEELPPSEPEPEQPVETPEATEAPFQSLQDLEADSGAEPLVNVLPPTEQPPVAEAPMAPEEQLPEADAQSAPEEQPETVEPTPISVPPAIPVTPEADAPAEPPAPEPATSAPEVPSVQPPAGPPPAADGDEEGLGLKQVSIDPQDGTLTEVENVLNAAPAAATPPPADAQEQIADQARDEVSRALNSAEAPVPPPQPAASLNAQPLGDALHSEPEIPENPQAPPTEQATPVPEVPVLPAPEVVQEPDAPESADAVALPSDVQPAEPTFSPFTNEPDTSMPPAPGVTDENPAPPVPPPLPPHVYQAGGNSEQQQ